MISDSNIVLHNTIFINFDLGDLQINRDLPLIICDHISKLGCNPIYQYMKHPETSFLHKIQNFCSNYDLDYRHSTETLHSLYATIYQSMVAIRPGPLH